MFNERATKKDIITEKAIGDGNCAYNSFILALFNQDVLEEIEKSLTAAGQDPNLVFKDFMSAVSEKFGAEVPKDWQSFKNFLLEIRRNNPTGLQEGLAPILRDLSITLAKQDPAHRERTIEPLCSAFRDYVDRANGVGNRGGVNDDVYNQHDHIGKQFKQLLDHDFSTLVSQRNFDLKRYQFLKQSEMLEDNEEDELVRLEQEYDDIIATIQKKGLVPWWETEGGYPKFLNEMMDKGEFRENNKWAGDYELYQLALYFHVNLDVLKQGMRHHIYINHGTFPKVLLDAEQLKLLSDRGIIDKPEAADEEVRFLRIDQDELALRLSALSPQDQELIELFLLDYELAPLTLIKAKVPNDWPETLLAQLYMRDIIRPIRNGTAYEFTLSVQDLRTRLMEVPEAERILLIWRHNMKKNPTLTLVNNYGIHWDLVRSGEVVVARQKDSKKKTSPTKDTNFKEMESTLLSRLKSNDREVTFNEKNYKLLIEKAKKEAQELGETLKKKSKEEVKKGIEAGTYVPYFFDKKNTLIISRDTQENLDEEYAKKLQNEDYESYKKRNG